MKKVFSFLVVFFIFVSFASAGIWHEEYDNKDYIHIQAFPVYGLGSPCLKTAIMFSKGKIMYGNFLTKKWQILPIVFPDIVRPMDNLIEIPEGTEKPAFFIWGYIF